MRGEVPINDQAMQRIGGALCALVPLSFGLAALILGQDSNWDLRNYHWYNPYAFLTGRFDQDIAPAHIPTYYNPLLDVPAFVLGGWLPARGIAFILGVVQGLNFILLYALALRVFAPIPEVRRRAAALLTALCGVTGAGSLSQLGATFYDNVLSLSVLGSTLIVVSGAPRPGRMLAAGALMGLGVGLKLPMAVFAVGLCIALLFVGGDFRQRLIQAFVFGLGVLAGFAVTGGFWAIHLWQAYANPVFPYFNALFHSPMGLPASYRDTRFVPESLAQALTFPIRIALNAKAAGEILFRDWRMAAVYLVLLATLGLKLARYGKNQAIAFCDQSSFRYLTVSAVMAYAAWLAMFGIYRYIVPLEMLAPLIAVAALASWPLPPRAAVSAAAALLALLVVSTLPGSWGRVPFTENFVEVDAPRFHGSDEPLILMAGTAPAAFVIPAFPSTASFVRIQGYINHPDDGDTGLNIAVRQRIAGHQGAIYLLDAEPERAFAETMLARYGLELAREEGAAACRRLATNLTTDLELCDVKRKDSTP